MHHYIANEPTPTRWNRMHHLSAEAAASGGGAPLHAAAIKSKEKPVRIDCVPQRHMATSGVKLREIFYANTLR
jgi:hypothetical protein